MTDVVRKYTPEQTEAFRHAIVRDHVIPAARKQFDQHPELQSAVMFVAQYWDDEALDAVHCDMAYSVSSEPDVDAYLAWRESNHDSADDYFIEWLIEGREGARRLGIEPDQLHSYHFGQYVDGWDSNAAVVAHFAAFTPEGGEQDGPFHLNNRPYAILRKQGDDVTVEVIGTMVRPWLDGVPGEWEAGRDAAASRAQTPRPSIDRRGHIGRPPGLLSRLFGKKRQL